MSSTDKKPSSRKSGIKKAASKKAKKTAARKMTAKKPVARKSAVEKAKVKKAAVKRVIGTKTSLDHDEVSKIGAKNLESLALDIDRQMKMLAEIDTRVIIAKDQLAEFREMIQAKISAFHERNENKSAASQKDLMTSIRETRDEAGKIIKDSKAIHDTYESAVKYFEKGRVSAMKEAKKAETVLLKKLHEVEAKMLKKAGELNKYIKSNKREK